MTKSKRKDKESSHDVRRSRSHEKYLKKQSKYKSNYMMKDADESPQNKQHNRVRSSKSSETSLSSIDTKKMYKHGNREDKQNSRTYDRDYKNYEENSYQNNFDRNSRAMNKRRGYSPNNKYSASPEREKRAKKSYNEKDIRNGAKSCSPDNERHVKDYRYDNKRSHPYQRDRDEYSNVDRMKHKSYGNKMNGYDFKRQPKNNRYDNNDYDDGFKESKNKYNRQVPQRDSAYERRRKRNNNDDDNNTYDWGKKTDKDISASPSKPIEKEKPNFGVSGALTEDTNKVNNVVVKYTEPPEARKPKRRWRLYPFKGETPLPTLHIHRQSAFLIGRERKVVDLAVDHPSCSKQHAALQYRLIPYTRDDGTQSRRVRLYLIDLESANGTFLNNKKIETRKYYELVEKDVIKFGFSTREYVLLHENSKDEAEDDDIEIDIKEEPEK